MNDKVIICMSTFNGSLYIDDQINSIVNQSYQNFSLLIRDDGSTDQEFIEKLKKYNSNNKQINILFEKNIGVTNSFFELLNKCPDDYDYIVLSDQDDVWYKNRLENTLQFACRFDSKMPLLCSCRYEYVDEDLKILGTPAPFKNFGFNNALVQNLATGCTVCINNSALKVLKRYTPKQAVIHDWWIYLVISAVGTVVQEPTISVKYRQHTSNVLGGTTSTIKKAHKRIKNKLNTIIYKVYKQVEEFYENYADLLNEESKNRVKQLLKTNDNLSSKFLFLFDFKIVKRESALDNLILKFIILFSRNKNKFN